jgi:hypothetical protein
MGGKNGTQHLNDEKSPPILNGHYQLIVVILLSDFN